MAEVTVPRSVVKFLCCCGKPMLLDAHALGKVVRCGGCGRYLRPALQFLLADKDRAPNLTVQCSCGHFVVHKADSSGKQVRCPICRKHLLMPQPVVKFDSPGVVRVPRKVLENQLKQVQFRRQRSAKEMTRLETAALSGRISLRPGEHICVNPDCGALLRAGANVCTKCTTNRLTQAVCEAVGPSGDPKGKWQDA